MGFGTSPSDIIIVATFARRLYRNCKNAGGEYLEISGEVRGLHTVLRHLKYEVEDDESILNRDQARYARELAPIIGDCDSTLQQLDDLLLKYGRNATTDGSGAGKLWDKIRFGSNELDALGDIRMKLINHKTSITIFLDTVQLHESGKMGKALDSQTGQLDIIIGKVDKIAARMGQRAASVMTTYEDDDKEVWKQFRRELVAEGFSSDILHKHKDVLRAYIRDIDQKGYLHESAPEVAQAPSSGIDTERWLDSVSQVQSPESELGTIPPSFSSLNVNDEDVDTKFLVSEENMKFPASIKEDIRKQVKAEEGDGSKQAMHPREVRVSTASAALGTTRRPIRPILTPHDSEDDSNDDELPARTTASSVADTLKPGGLDIPKSNRRLSHGRDASPMGSPSSYQSNLSYMSDVRQNARLNIHTTHLTQNTASMYGTSPKSSAGRPETPSSRLAPDSYGNPIPEDAKWTKIRRKLVSPEILAEDGLRFETRSEHVFVLGTLTREDIEDLAERSLELRASRAHRTAPPVQPPRPSRRTQQRSSGSDDESDDESKRRRPRHKERNTYPQASAAQQIPPYPYGYSPNATWPAPVAMPMPHQQWAQQPRYSSHSSNGWTQPLSPVYQLGAGSTQHTTSKERRKSSDVKEKIEGKGRKKWKSNLTAAGVGGAAGSLLSVLVEAAQDL